MPKSVWETYSSFANTDGGVILFGVEEHMREKDFSKRFSFATINNPDHRIKDFWNTINSEKVSSNILVDADIGICMINGHTIVWIKVPQANYKQRPVYINGNPMKGTFKRNYEGDYHCSEDEIKAMLRDASDTGNDGGLLNGYTIDDIDMNALRSYRIEFEHRNPDHVWNGDDDLTFLKIWKAILLIEQPEKVDSRLQAFLCLVKDLQYENALETSVWITLMRVIYFREVAGVTD